MTEDMRVRQTRWIIYSALLLVVVVGLGLRTYRLDELVTFLGDQGRDVTAVWRMVETGQPALLGPGSAFGLFQRGPIYYYFLLSGLATTGGDPIGAALAIVLLDAATIVLIFFAARSFSSPVGAFTAAALYATVGAAVSLARAFSNPSILPFLSLLLFVSVTRILRGEARFLAVAAGAGAAAWQVHDQAVLLLIWAASVLILVYPLLSWRAVGLAVLVGLVLIAPFLWYEAQHNLVNLRAMLSYVTSSAAKNAQGNVFAATLARLAATWEIVQAFLPFDGVAHWAIVATALAGLGTLLLDVWRTRKTQLKLFALYCTLPLLYVIWPGPVYASNLEIVLPIPFLLVGFVVGRLIEWQPRVTLAIGAAVILVSAVSAFQIIMQLNAAKPTVKNLFAIRQAAETIITEADNKPFAFQLDTSKDNTEAYETPYTYLLKWRGGQFAANADAQTFAVFDPAERASGEMNAGTVVNDIRVVRFLPPSPIGENLLEGAVFSSQGDVKEWNIHAPDGASIYWDEKNTGLALRGDGSADPIMAVQRIDILPNAHYLVAFEYRNELRNGTQRTYLLCFDAQHNFVKTFPASDGYAVEQSSEWQRGSFLVSTPSSCVHASVWLQQAGSGTSWFRKVSLKEARLEVAP